MPGVYDWNVNAPNPTGFAGSPVAGVAASVSPQFAVVSGGLACVVGVAICALALPAFLRYDHREASAERELDALDGAAGVT